MKSLKTILVGSVISILCLSSVAFGATNGTLGPTSTGSVTIKVTLPGLVQISGLTDTGVDFGTLTAAEVASGVTKNEAICVYSNSAGKYNITATGDGAANAFTVKDTATVPNTIAYKVQWADTGSATSGSDLTAGTPSTGHTGASETSATCMNNANPTAKVFVEFTTAALDLKPAGAYSGDLTLVVAPE